MGVITLILLSESCLCENYLKLYRSSETIRAGRLFELGLFELGPLRLFELGNIRAGLFELSSTRCRRQPIAHRTFTITVLLDGDTLLLLSSALTKYE